MNLQEFLEQRFTRWSPPAPEVLTRTKHSITLDWHRLEPFVFLAGQLLYRLEKNEKVPPWCVVYRGGKTTKEIVNLAPRQPHRFRLKVIVKAEAVRTLADRATQCYGDAEAAYATFKRLTNDDKIINSKAVNDECNANKDAAVKEIISETEDQIPRDSIRKSSFISSIALA